MTTQYSKMTITNWGNLFIDADTGNPLDNPILQYLSAKLLDMSYYSGKTDGNNVLVSTDPHIRKRYWTDDAAAQEWKQFVMEDLGPKFQCIPISLDIVDNPDYTPNV